MRRQYLKNTKHNLHIVNFAFDNTGDGRDIEQIYKIMTILEKLLAEMHTKFPGADEPTLIRIATKKSEGVTDESKVKTIADGITWSEVMKSFGDARANQAQSSAIETYEKKYSLKGGKPVKTPQEPKPAEEPKPDDPKPADDTPAWAKQLIASNKDLADRLSSVEKGRAQETWQERINTAAGKVGISKDMLGLIAPGIPKDANIEEYLQNAKQTVINSGYSPTPSPQPAEEQHEKESEGLAKMINDKTAEMVETQKS